MKMKIKKINNKIQEYSNHFSVELKIYLKKMDFINTYIKMEIYMKENGLIIIKKEMEN